MDKVEVYVQERCPQCTATIRKLNQLGVTYTQKQTKDYLDFLQALGAQTAPVVIVYLGGRVHKWWAGYRPDHITALAEPGWEPCLQCHTPNEFLNSDGICYVCENGDAA